MKGHKWCVKRDAQRRLVGIECSRCGALVVGVRPPAVPCPGRRTVLTSS